jgi:hypothetical protein
LLRLFFHIANFERQWRWETPVRASGVESVSLINEPLADYCVVDDTKKKRFPFALLYEHSTVIGLYDENVWYKNCEKNISPLKQLQTSAVQLASNPFFKLVQTFLQCCDPGRKALPIVT